MNLDTKKDKPFMTYDELVQKLVKEKNLIINDNNYAIKLLKSTVILA